MSGDADDSAVGRCSDDGLTELVLGELDLTIERGDGRAAIGNGEGFLGGFLFGLGFLDAEAKALFEAIERRFGGVVLDGGELDDGSLMLKLLRGNNDERTLTVGLLQAGQIIASLVELSLG